MNLWAAKPDSAFDRIAWGNLSDVDEQPLYVSDIVETM
jgi:hypothetical protein